MVGDEADQEGHQVGKDNLHGLVVPQLFVQRVPPAQAAEDLHHAHREEQHGDSANHKHRLHGDDDPQLVPSAFGETPKAGRIVGVA